MKQTLLFTPAALALAITMAAAPALAQPGDREGRRRTQNQTTRSDSGSQDKGSRGDGSRTGVAVPRSATPRADSSRGNEPQSDAGRSTNRGTDNRVRDNRGTDNRVRDNRSTDNRGYDNRSNDNRGRDNRGYDNRGYDNRRDNSWQYSNRDYGWRGSYDRNAWRSRIRFGLGISIFAGHSFGFRFDYGWRPGFNYRYPMRPGVAYGGMSFLLNPDDAEVYIDGDFVGIARDFGGQPVPVAVGFHRIELYASGFEPVAFDINVFPGQVIPYRGNLGRIY